MVGYVCALELRIVLVLPEMVMYGVHPTMAVHGHRQRLVHGRLLCHLGEGEAVVTAMWVIATHAYYYSANVRNPLQSEDLQYKFLKRSIIK